MSSPSILLQRRRVDVAARVQNSVERNRIRPEPITAQDAIDLYRTRMDGLGARLSPSDLEGVPDAPAPAPVAAAPAENHGEDENDGGDDDDADDDDGGDDNSRTLGTRDSVEKEPLGTYGFCTGAASATPNPPCGEEGAGDPGETTSPARKRPRCARSIPLHICIKSSHSQPAKCR